MRTYLPREAATAADSAAKPGPVASGAPVDCVAAHLKLTLTADAGQYATGASVVPGAPDSVRGPKSKANV